MKSARRIKLLLNEDVYDRDGVLQEELVPHTFSPEFAIEIVQTLLRALSGLLTRLEMHDLETDLLSVLRERERDQEIAPARRGHLTIHEPS